jgi:hypothetical protein
MILAISVILIIIIGIGHFCAFIEYLLDDWNLNDYFPNIYIQL